MCATITGFAVAIDLGDLWTANLTPAQFGTAVGEWTVAIVAPGALAPSPVPAGGQ
jgi:hypothetical protein